MFICANKKKYILNISNNKIISIIESFNIHSIYKFEKGFFIFQRRNSGEYDLNEYEFKNNKFNVKRNIIKNHYFEI